jgi:hypothetical protein
MDSTNTPAAASTWTSFFASNAKCLLYNEAGVGLQEMTASGKSVDDCLSAIDGNPTVPLMVLSPLNKVHILFGLKTIGNDIFSPEKSYVFLSPHGASCTPVEIDLVDILHATFSFPGPSVDAFKAADSTAKIKALDIAPTATVFHSRKIFALPPFVGAKFTDLDHQPSPLDALLIISKALSEHDSSHEGSNLFSILLPSMNFLWTTIQDLDFQTTAFTVVSPAFGQTATDWASSFSKSYLHAAQPHVSTSDLITNAATNVAANLYGLQNEIHGLRSDRVTEKSKAKGNFSSWHETTQRMVLFAASIDGETPSEEPTDFLNSFCKIQKSTDAQTVLIQSMLASQGCTVQISAGFVAALQKGLWLWTHQSVPSNLTILAVPRPNGHVEETVQDLVLALKSETPSLFSESDLKQLTRQPMSFPSATDVNDLEAHYMNMAGLLTLLLGEDSLLTRYAKSWTQHLRTNFGSYQNQAVTDPLFIRKLLFSFDVRVQTFLRACMNAPRRDAVNSSYLESSGLFTQIVMQNFHAQLPAAYLPATPRLTPHEDRRRSNPYEDRRRSNQYDDRAFTSRQKPNPPRDSVWGPEVQNMNQIPDWDITRLNIEFRKFNRPSNPGPPDICKKWHLKGSCYVDCPRKLSHQVLINPAKKAFSQWVASCK